MTDAQSSGLKPSVAAEARADLVQAKAAIRFGAVILCGGRSQRMNQPKEWLPWHGVTLLEHVVGIAGKAASIVVVAGREDQKLPPLPAGVVRANDEAIDAGPLAGMATGLAALQGLADAAFVLSCDLPLITAEFLLGLSQYLPGFDAVVPVVKGYVQPLCAVYRVDLAARARDLLAGPRHDARILAESCRAKYLHDEELSLVDPNRTALLNCNTPEEYRELLNKVERQHREG